MTGINHLGGLLAFAHAGCTEADAVLWLRQRGMTEATARELLDNLLATGRLERQGRHLRPPTVEPTPEPEAERWQAPDDEDKDEESAPAYAEALPEGDEYGREPTTPAPPPGPRDARGRRLRGTGMKAAAEILRTRGPMTAYALAAALELHRSSGPKVASRLCKHGLARRRSDGLLEAVDGTPSAPSALPKLPRTPRPAVPPTPSPAPSAPASPPAPLAALPPGLDTLPLDQLERLVEIRRRIAALDTERAGLVSALALLMRGDATTPAPAPAVVVTPKETPAEVVAAYPSALALEREIWAALRPPGEPGLTAAEVATVVQRGINTAHTALKRMVAAQSATRRGLCYWRGAHEPSPRPHARSADPDGRPMRVLDEIKRRGQASSQTLATALDMTAHQIARATYVLKLRGLAQRGDDGDWRPLK